MNTLKVKTRLDNLRLEAIPQTPEASYLHNARLSVVSWIYNNGNLRTENELKMQNNSLTEEIDAYTLINNKGLMYQAAQAKLQELNQLT